VSLFIVVIIILFQRDSVSYLLVAYLTGNVVAMLVSYKKLQIYLVDDLADEPNIESKENYTKKTLKYGLKSHLSNILAFVNYRADILIGNGIAGPAAAGVYIVSIQLTEKIWLLSQSVGTVLLPKLSELSGDDNKKKKLTPQVSRWVLFITFFLATLLGSVSYVLIEFLFGDKFMGAVSALLILLPGTVLASSSRVLANDVASRGKPELNMYSSIFVVVTNISLNLILIPDFGIQGAALATTLAYSLNFILRLFIYRYLTGAVFTDVIFLKKSDVKMFISLIKGTR
jgi:O-antigen/teichoic acid export membrane protein